MQYLHWESSFIRDIVFGILKILVENWGTENCSIPRWGSVISLCGCYPWMWLPPCFWSWISLMYLGQRGICVICFPTSLALLSCLYDIFSLLSYFVGLWPTVHLLMCQRGHWEQSPLPSKWPPLRWRRKDARSSLVMPLSMTFYLEEYSKKGYMNMYPIPMKHYKTILKLKTYKILTCVSNRVFTV